MKMGQKYQSDEGLLFVISKEIMRGKYFGREFFGFWAKHEELFFMSRRFVPRMFTKWCAHSVEYSYYLLILIVRISTKFAALNYLQVPRLISNDIRAENLRLRRIKCVWDVWDPNFNFFGTCDRDTLTKFRPSRVSPVSHVLSSFYTFNTRSVFAIPLVLSGPWSLYQMACYK